MDWGPDFNMTIHWSAIENADVVLLVITPERTAILDVRNILPALERAFGTLQKFRIVLNGFDERFGISPKEVVKFLDGKVTIVGTLPFAPDEARLAINTGVLGTTDLFEVGVAADQMAAAGGGDLGALRDKNDRGEAMKVMAAGAPVLVKRLYEEGGFDGIIGMGGGGGTAVITAGMRALPVGVPKVCVSTVASGNTADYVGTKDVVLIPSIVDVAGINRISRIIFTRAVGAICGMVDAEPQAPADEKPIITASMFGNTTECVNACMAALTAEGFEVLVFHATGTGGQTMESLVREGLVDAVICPVQPATFFAVGAWYDDFGQVSDDTVISLLERRIDR